MNSAMIEAESSTADTNVPRKPERVNGRRRYAELVAAAERLLERDGLAHLTIQKIAREAKVPMASVYHFFPSPTAACLAVAETFLDGFAAALSEEIDNLEAMAWRDVIAVLQARTVEFYANHPYAGSLLLGSDRSWHIRQHDLANNRAMAETISRLIARHFPWVEPNALERGIVNAISIGDAIWALSIAEHGRITPDYADEALLAACSYIEARFASDQPDK